MKFICSVILIIYLSNQANCSEWECKEIGPYIDEKSNIVNKTINTHKVSHDDVMTLNSGVYRIADISKILEKSKGSDKYEYKSHIVQCHDSKTNQTINFNSHPFTFKPKENDSFTKSVSSSHNMTCGNFGQTDKNHIYINWSWSFKNKLSDVWDVIDMNNSIKYSIKVGLHQSSLKVRSVKPEDSGFYKCVAFNEYGSHEQVFQLRILGLYALILPFCGVLSSALILSALVMLYEKVSKKKALDYDMKSNHPKTVNA